ncbi:uncharacterized protein LOC131157361 isoform X1 [Malania oleifera]|uniref:uncharacterized protein LOC131157361 isoform X1 n=1 Tax=Malania oleifera TaxID=397392 RepID=UPI0025AEA1A1|nr:uncharacterized protein LOC131157361 isoform X1 [Malania oleifera]XP_057967424.1 uncharacterized protein LOC131157361 isoform X1 [Malania oleifera]
MISLSPSPSLSLGLTIKPLGFSFSPHNPKPSLNPRRRPKQRRIGRGTCRAEFSQDAPLAIAIGACMLNSLVFPIPSCPDGDGDSVMDSTDARFAVMGVISFIPYFNWLSWVFAWLDTGKRRYVVYSIVYLAPYLRSNLSLSPEESWLPIASIVFCIIHVQLEASIRNGDLQGFQIFNEVVKYLPFVVRKKDGHPKSQKISGKGRVGGHRNLPSADEQSRNEIEGWGVPREPSKDPKHLNKDQGDDRRSKH